MSETIESIYPKIGQYIVDAIQEPWDIATITVEINDDVFTIRGHYSQEGNNIHKSINLYHEIFVLIEELHARMADEMNDNWNQAVFELANSGEFSINFEY